MSWCFEGLAGGMDGFRVYLNLTPNNLPFLRTYIKKSEEGTGSLGSR